MIEYWDYFISGYDSPTGGMGMATTLPVESGRDFAEELREAVFEATGKRVEASEPRRIGFV